MTTKFKYLFVIPNTIPPYGYEFVNILCLPLGFKGRFRFKEKWVSEEFKSTYKAYISKPIHILLRDIVSSTIFPLRKAIVDDIIKIGDTYLIKYTLNNYFNYDSKESERVSQLDEYQRRFLEYHDGQLLNNKPNADMSPLVFGSSFNIDFVNNHFDTQDSCYKDLETFRNTIDLIKNIKFFESVIFTKIIYIRVKNTTNAPNVVNGAYNLKEDTDYEISIYQTAPMLTYNKDELPNDISINVDSKYISVIKGKQRIVGKYDIINLIFRTNTNTAGAGSFIDIAYKLKSDQAAEKYIDPNISLPISITFKYRGIINRIIALFAFIVLYLYAYIFKAFSESYACIIRDISLVSVAVIIFDFKSKFIDYIKRQ